MWMTSLKTALAGLLAFAALAGLAAVWHDQPYAYPVICRAGPVTVCLRATLRHVAFGGWRTRDSDISASMQPYWEGAGLDIYTLTFHRMEERNNTDAAFAAAHSVRVGEFGVLRGRRGATIASAWDLNVPTWFATGVGVLPLILVVVGRSRRQLRGEAGHCRECGYDLRASPGRCPECGTEPRVDPGPASVGITGPSV